MKSITISGDLGSGKSIVAKALAGTLNCSYLSTGTIQRGIAAEMNMTTLELNKYSETHPEIDERIDSIFAELDRSEECHIVDSRMAWHFLKSAVKVHLIVDVEIAARRIMGDDSRNSVEKYAHLEQAKADILSRKQSENLRFLDIYQADCSALSNYDIIVETSVAKPDEVTQCILDCYYAFQGREKRYFVSPKSLVPTAAAAGESGAPSGPVAAPGYDPAQPIDVVMLEGVYVIWDGNERASAALQAGVPLVAVRVLACDDQQARPGLSVRSFVTSAVNRSLLAAWEERHQFQFLKYPAL